MDKNLLSDIRSYILTEYQSLKLESKTDLKTSKSIQNLAILLSKYSTSDIKVSINSIKQNIYKSTNPIELMRELETYMKTYNKNNSRY